ncbi:hypothetical protein PDE_07093 [Penicillium oxalicum 114-2]|uniref:Uncharacterized protein n=1 Tax=Penicillium oxalicum (strain 114-2 / CGMCC 5302) TaxID=933388 RepID=S7ZP27_PENO1|nr:hypothetical protein PDE_07093 [Penicillium oxalicum 114-2]
MSSLSIRLRAPIITHSHTIRAPTSLCRLTRSRAIHLASATRLNHQRNAPLPCKVNSASLALFSQGQKQSIERYSTPSIRNYSSTSSPAKPTADNLIEELQDLYETAKDEFEIATESTDGSTIYASSDRESARDALNQLCAVYHLYTARPGEDVDSGVRNTGSKAEGDEAVGEGDAIVETNFNPGDVSREVREEVRRRVGQRVRELRNAVELLEERAQAD